MEKKRVYRNEWKYLVSYPEGRLLQDRLSPFLHLDKNVKDGDEYTIRSLYFDDYNDSSYRDKVNGVVTRKKWRIRIYNYSDDVISLERKSKEDSYIFKETAGISHEEFDRIIAGDYEFLLYKERNLYKEFYVELMSRLLRPKVIVDYERTPLVQDEGTVRITFDKNVRAAVGSWDIFDPDLPTLPAMNPNVHLVEVKYTEFLPQLIKQLLPMDGQDFTAFSKYSECYEAAHHLTDITAGINKTLDRRNFR